MPRQPPPVVLANFTRGEKLDNSSNHYYFSCNACSQEDDSPGRRIEHRDNALLEHLANKCSKADSSRRRAALLALEQQGKHTKVKAPAKAKSSGSRQVALAEGDNEDGHGVDGGEEVGQKRRRFEVRDRRIDELDGYIDVAMTEEEQRIGNILLFRFIVHANLAFRISEDAFFLDYIHHIRPSCDPATRYVISHSILDSEAARVQLHEMDLLATRRNLTFLIDGWEDELRRSLYGSVAAQVNEYPSMLALEDMTGKRATAENVLVVMKNALRKMGLDDGRAFIALVTDNPTTMQAFRRLASSSGEFKWLLTLACFLHSVNSILGDIASYPAAKRNTSQATAIVSYFNSSHYWGGQLADIAKELKITRGMSQNCESRWYALILQAVSVLDHREALQRLCLRQDAVTPIGGLTPVKLDVRKSVVGDASFFPMLSQIARMTKPIVDVIGNTEARDVNLADCMLDLIKCARNISKLELQPGDDPAFLEHVRRCFDRRFQKIATPLHRLALFLHPHCRQLAVSGAVGGYGTSFDDLLQTAVEIALKWDWTMEEARTLVDDMRTYFAGVGIYSGSRADGYTWWQDRPASGECTLKAMAISIFSIAPHSAEVERLFSQLGGVMTPKRCNLTVDNFEALGKCRNHYARELWLRDRKAGKSTHRKHAHMHTKTQPGINTATVDSLTVVPPLDPAAEGDAGSEESTMSKLSASFEKHRLRSEEELKDVEVVEGSEVTKGRQYKFDELEKVEKGLSGTALASATTVLGSQDGTAPKTWSKRAQIVLPSTLPSASFAALSPVSPSLVRAGRASARAGEVPADVQLNHTHVEEVSSHVEEVSSHVEGSATHVDSHGPSCSVQNTSSIEQRNVEPLKVEDILSHCPATARYYPVDPAYLNPAANYIRFVDLQSTKIPRAPNAFIIYRSWIAAALRQSRWQQYELSRMIGDRWNNLPEETRKPFESAAELVKERHGALYPTYKYKPKRTYKPWKPTERMQQEFDLLGWAGKPIPYKQLGHTNILTHQ
ncbi:unnamed protein product [Peniophora sp. CBMAI 1063]|nr:unnamed protein product [Peniophora sp. CBMAI 1063]